MLKLGVNLDIPNESYHKDVEYVSSSGLKIMLKDPKLYYKKYVLGESDYTTSAAFDFGSYLHALILEPHTVEDEYAIYEGKVRRGKDYDKFKELNIGKVIITRSQYLQAMSLLEAYTENELAKSLIQNGAAEQTVTAILDEVKVKARTDYIKFGEDEINIIDVKTTSDPTDRLSVGKTIARYDYDLSAALYIDTIQTVHKNKEVFFTFLFLNKQTNEVEAYRASDSMIENGRRKYKAALRMLKEAKKTGKYFEEGIEEVTLPSWAIFDENTK